MRKIRNKISIVSFSLLLLFSITGCSEAVSPSSGLKSDLPEGSEQVTFVELGSVKCIPCKKMQPIIEAVEKEYAGKVKVVFHDVWTSEGKEYGKKYNIRMIPTQVFIDRDGKEIFRNEGFLSQDAIGKVLDEAGVKK